MNRQQFWPDIAAETFGFNRGEKGGNIKNLAGFRQTDHVVFQLLAINIGHAKRHLRLVVNENQCRIIFIKQLKFRHYLPSQKDLGLTTGECNVDKPHGRQGLISKIAQNFCRLVEFFYTRRGSNEVKPGSVIDFGCARSAWVICGGRRRAV
ncbi:hypothetical protein D3C72_1601380 [compost metagenome]